MFAHQILSTYEAGTQGTAVGKYDTFDDIYHSLDVHVNRLIQYSNNSNIADHRIYLVGPCQNIFSCCVTISFAILPRAPPQPSTLTGFSEISIRRLPYHSMIVMQNRMHKQFVTIPNLIDCIRFKIH